MLEQKRGVRNLCNVPLTISQILKWADAHHRKTGVWPKVKSGDVFGAPGEKWEGIERALSRGLRGLPGRSSLAQLLEAKRGARNLRTVPDLTISQILKWADAHHQKTGEWPKVESGDVFGAPGEKWGNIHAALSMGNRGLPGGSTLAKLLMKNRAARSFWHAPPLTITQILKWADAHHRKTGEWPKAKSGGVLEAHGEKWQNIANALSIGLRGLPGGSSLAKLLAEKRRAK